MSEISRDLFADKIANILHDITQDTFQLNVGRFDLIEYWGNHLHDIVKLYYLLNDNTSRETYVKLLRFNFAVTLLGERVKDKYALYNTKIWNKLTELANKIQDHVQDDYILDRIETFILEGYNYRDICCPNHGDVVFDCGAYTGNTALYFSKKVGSSGQVYAFEAMPNIYEILCNNISLDNVIKENFAVSNKSGILYFK
ncbi:MAG: FkbM family methyltransferase [Desulfovibrionaceae bacterium]|nr:FkbM family methyltransferase [Desulfovibrionaceae bacterium]